MPICHELKDLVCTIDRAAVLRAMQCSVDSPACKTVVREYEKIYPRIFPILKPVGIVGMDRLPASAETAQYRAGLPVIYMCTSIGGTAVAESRSAFQEGNYLEGLLWDTMADCALFSLEKAAVEQLRAFCAENGVGICAQLSAPEDIPMSIQRVIWERLELKKRFGIHISDGYMFDPVKTVCTVFVLTEDSDIFQAGHDCRKCGNTGCLFRSIPDVKVTVCQGGHEEGVLVKAQERLIDTLIRQGYKITAACGGKGRCNKCGIRILEGNAAVSDADRQAFSETELAAGWRLSCQLFPVEDLKISLPIDNQGEFEVIAEHSENTELHEEEDQSFFVSIDIGTTTVAMELLGAGSGKIIHSATIVNSQRVYGADVMTRIDASVNGKQAELQQSIQKDLKSGFQRLLADGGVDRAKVGHIAVSGNTTMTHLLMGYDCTKLGTYPFQPVTTDFIEGSGKEILGFETAETSVLPGISAFVGGDIVSGLYACGFHKTEELCLLIDLGTNGEMALGSRDRILVTSTAAGPAFEGGNISCGMGSVNGAICAANYKGGGLALKTIGGKEPVGICGTGVIELTAALLSAGYLSETGALCEKYFASGVPLATSFDGKGIVFTQKDVRELQLAKSAIRAGIEVLLLKYGVRASDVKQIYLAGGFGYRLDAEKAIAIGMIPKAFEGRIQAVGNSSLAGTSKYLLSTTS